MTCSGSYPPPTCGSSHWVNKDELDEIKTVNGLLSAVGFRRVPILRVQSTKPPFPWPTFPALWRRWKEHRTMRQTVLESPLQWEENTTAHQLGCHWKHIIQWKHAHELTQTQTSFLSLSSLAAQRASPNVSSNAWLLHKGVVVLLRIWLISFPLTLEQGHTWKSCSTTSIIQCLHVSSRLAGSAWPPVFTHKQSKLQPDQPVWVWSAVSHSPGDPLPPQTGAHSGHQPFPLCASQILLTTLPQDSMKHMSMFNLSVSKHVLLTHFA